MTDMHELPHPLLLDYLDGRLDPEQARAVAVWIAEDAARGRLVAQHRAAWDALALANPSGETPRVSAAFAERLLARARTERNGARAARTRVLRIAAALLVAVGLWAAFRPSAPALLPFTVSSSSALERELVEKYGDDLDLIADYHALQAIEGQLDGVLPR